MAAPRSSDPERVGRFLLLRVLGRGSQSTVWLARDVRLERDVALKLMEPGAADGAEGLGHWLTEARHVAALSHPHIVSLFEADVHGSGRQARPYLVFEYVPGTPLDRHLLEHGPFAPRQAVEWLLGVADGLARAHAAGLVHRDLKPSNLMVDAEGRARVTDFGIASRSGATALAAGTPRYLAPETLRGEPPAPPVDVFALGLLLAELMLGHALVADTEPGVAMARIRAADLSLPDEMPEPVDDGLRAIIRRALSCDPDRRHADAGQFRDALRAWLAPSQGDEGSVEGVGAGPGASSRAAALNFLLRRMRHKSDFPALSDSVSRIQRVAVAENANLGSLAAEILKDVGLTHKLLRLVNTAHYRSAGGSISTVSRAVALMGFAGVRKLSLSLILVEHMHDKRHAQQITQEFLRALLAGTLAEEICPAALARLPGAHAVAEEALIGAMFQHLGRLLCEFYFPEEAEQVRRLVRPLRAIGRETAPVPLPEATASQQVLGLSYQELGQGVARHWGLPETLQRCMNVPVGPPPRQAPASVTERLRWIATLANEISDALLDHEPEEVAPRIEEIAQRYARAVGLPSDELLSALVRSRARLSELAEGLEIRLRPGAQAERLLAPRKPDIELQGQPSGQGSVSTLAGLLVPGDIEATMRLAEARGRDRPAAADPAAVLAAGIQDITNSMVEDARLGELLRMILETMYRAMGFRRVLFGLRDARSAALLGRFMLGEGGDEVRDAFRIETRLPAGASPDLFTSICLKGADTLIADATRPSVRARLPDWYLQSCDAPCFLLLPLMVKGTPVGLIYADKCEPGSIVIAERELALLRTLRNQAVMAFRQSGRA